MAIIATKPFSNYFDLTSEEIKGLEIKENSNNDNCYIHKGGEYFAGFMLVNNPKVKTVCSVSFYKSKVDNKYLPRLEFRKTDPNGTVKQSKRSDVIINFGDGDEARAFWKMIHFLQGFKDLVDLGDFHAKYQAVSFEHFLVGFESKENAERISELMRLAEKTKLSNEEIKNLLFPQRRKNLHWFYALLKHLSNSAGKNAFETYRTKFDVTELGEEAVWHHFLKENDWIIGLNVDVRFIRDLLSEQKVGAENSLGKGSPKVDLLGISYFTSLIELKTSKTKIFKSEKAARSRANTWDFSNDFIEAYSQTLAQRSELREEKEIIDEQGKVVDTKIHRILDPKSVLIIGTRNEEFPHDRTVDSNVKSDCFERLRRDNRNIEIITYDELFERAFHIVYTEKLPENWFSMDSHDFIRNVLKVN